MLPVVADLIAIQQSAVGGDVPVLVVEGNPVCIQMDADDAIRQVAGNRVTVLAMLTRHVLDTRPVVST